MSKDIIAEDVSDHANLREKLSLTKKIMLLLFLDLPRPLRRIESTRYTKIIQNLFLRSHLAYLAINRAENEKQLNVSLNMSDEK